MERGGGVLMHIASLPGPFGIGVFGEEAVKNFCICNAWKYRYRAADKNGEEDLKKSDWYLNKYKELCDLNKKSTPVTIPTPGISPLPYQPNWIDPVWYGDRVTCQSNNK